MQTVVPLACFLSMIRPPGVQYENSLLQIAPVDKSKCPFIKNRNDIGFQLFTRHNPTEYQELVVGDDERLFASNINFGDQTVVYFHAFMEQPDDGSGIMVREAYMQRGDTNVIMIDAHHLEAGPWYFTAAQNTWYIGRFAAQFIDYMVSRGLNLNNTHFIGHSLGAQAAGVAGTALTSGRVARITGLDPALPLFSHLPLEQRLDTSDADFVDVIHTDAGIFGYKVPVGHVDFYPNGGQSPQPGCELEVVIPQQLLLNKCDGRDETRGFYIYYLTDHHHYTETYKTNKNSKEKLSNGLKNISSFEKVLKTTVEDKEELKGETSDETQIKLTNDTQKYSDHKTMIENIEYKIKHVRTHAEERTQAYKELNRMINELKLTDMTKGEGNMYTVNIKTRKSDVITDTIESKSKNKNNVQGTVKFEQILDTLTKINERVKDRTEHASIKTRKSDLMTDTVESKIKNANGKEGTVKLEQILDALTKINEKVTDRTTENKIEDIIESLFVTETEHKETRRHKRQKRFLNIFKDTNTNDNFVTKALNFLVKNRKNILPVFSVVREINTLVKSQNGELSHVAKETSNFIGGSTPVLPPLSYTLELGNESRVKAFVKKLLGLSPSGDRLTISGGGK